MASTRYSELTLLGQNRSACTPDHLQGLVDLVDAVKNIPGDIVEIGSYKCGGTIILAAASEICSPHKKVFAFDTFSGMPAVSEADQHKAGDFGDVDFEEVKKVTSALSNIELVQGRHEDTVPNFSPQPVSLLFLDSDLYRSHLVSLQHFWPLLSKNGIAVFHDWNTADCLGVKKAISEFFGTRMLNQTFVSGMFAVKK